MTMNAVTNASEYDWQTWLVGIWRALIGGGAGAVVSGFGTMVVDPDHFNFHGGFSHVLEMMGISFLFGALIHMMIYLQTHSAPELVVVKSTETTVLKVSPRETQVSAVETTTTVPATPEKKP